MQEYAASNSMSFHKGKRSRSQDDIPFTIIKRLSINEKNSYSFDNNSESDLESIPACYDADNEIEQANECTHPDYTLHSNPYETDGEEDITLSNKRENINSYPTLKTCYRRKIDFLTDELIRKSVRRNDCHKSVGNSIIPNDQKFSLPNIGPHPQSDQCLLYNKSNPSIESENYSSEDLGQDNEKYECNGNLIFLT